MGKFIDLSGKKFGRLTVIERGKDYVSPKGYVAVNWVCECDCGNIVEVRGCNLKSGASTSCGCNRVDFPNRLRHGGTHTRLHKIWMSMRNRCYNKNEKAYIHYGGRGILVCAEWSDFACFREWALANGYSDNLTLDRINNDGCYCPDNCRWVDMTVQANNKRNNHYLEYNGATHTLAEWSAITGISYHKLKDRINKCHWSAEKALTTQ